MSQPQPDKRDLEINRLLRQLPSVDGLLNSLDGQAMVTQYGYTLGLEATRLILDQHRERLKANEQEVPSQSQLLDAINEWLEISIQSTLEPVINASGIILHTNLGRAPLSKTALMAVNQVAGGYSNLEFDLDLGERGSRMVHAEEQLKHLTGAQAALVVNNNAAAVLLMLRALCAGREVVISRGQLVEIGGGFRVPDVMTQSGAQLVEVGTTNRTHLRDYIEAISENTAAILVAHHSNFRIIGFTVEPAIEELVKVAKEHNILLLYDQGSGAFIDTALYGLEREPLVTEAVHVGVDIVAFSGDKLLGGPQAGILCGRAELIAQIKRHPLARALRADKMCLAALTETLRAHITERATQELPIWQMISKPLEEIRVLANNWRQTLIEKGVQGDVVKGDSIVGGGSLPGNTLPTYLVAVNHPELNKLASALRRCDPPIVARVANDRLLIDPRTVLEGQAQHLLESVVSCSEEL